MLAADCEAAAGQVTHRMMVPLLAPTVRVLLVRHQVTVPLVPLIVRVLLVMPWVTVRPVMLIERVVVWPDVMVGVSAWPVSGRWV